MKRPGPGSGKREQPRSRVFYVGAALIAIGLCAWLFSGDATQEVGNAFQPEQPTPLPDPLGKMYVPPTTMPSAVERVPEVPPLSNAGPLGQETTEKRERAEDR